MIKELLYTSALDSDDNLVMIDDAEKGNSYYCPECKGELILRKSGKTGKGSKRPHFAHHNITGNCTPEGVLHYTFKRKTRELLERYLIENQGFEINWNCTNCTENNKINLLQKVTSIREEYNLKICQPDIALLDTEENVIAVIEIVVTHKPEEKVLQYYKENKIILVQVDLSSDEDLKNVEKKVSIPSIVDYCLNPGCSTSDRYSISRKIVRYPDKCGRCYQPVERYLIEMNGELGRQRSLNFTDSEISFVKSKINYIEVKTDKLTNEKYPIRACLSCKRMQMRRGNTRF